MLFIYLQTTLKKCDHINNNYLFFQDTFYDPEDTTDLKLRLLTPERNELDPKHWLQFDTKNQEFYGIPKHTDAGKKEYILVAEDREGLTAIDALVVIANHPPHRDYSVTFDFTLGMPYENFNNSAAQRRFVERLAQVFNDPTTSNIQLHAIRKIHQIGKTQVKFYNTTLHRPHNVCPSDVIEELKQVLFYHGNVMRPRVKNIIGNEFDLTQIDITPTGPCSPNGGEKKNQPTTVKTDTTNISGLKDDYLLTFVLPAIIILAMIFLACIIACVLHRRRMTGKMELGMYQGFFFHSRDRNPLSTTTINNLQFLLQVTRKNVSHSDRKEFPLYSKMN